MRHRLPSTLYASVLLTIFASTGLAFAQAGGLGAAGAGPTDARAAKMFADAVKLEKDHKYALALDGFRRADIQEGSHCIPCEMHAYAIAKQIQDYKSAKEQAALLLANVTTPEDKAEVHLMTGEVCLAEGGYRIFEEPFKAADSEFQAALQLQPEKPDCLYQDGLALAHLHQYEKARERFQQYLKASPSASAKDVQVTRARLFATQPELARKRVAPEFQVVAMDGKPVSMASLQGKVVLLDFWATWCGPCVKYLPHLKELVKEFEGQPLVVISVSLDTDEKTWKYFVEHNGMTWTQYRDGSFDGPIATQFAVKAIPTTFSIDADGFVQDQQVGDGDIEAKLKKLLQQATDAASHKTLAEVHQP